MKTSDPTIESTETRRVEAPVVLTDSPPRPLRFFDQFAMWANLGISLFGPLTGALVSYAMTLQDALNANGTDSAAIAAKADNEYLYDKPYENKKVVRVAAFSGISDNKPFKLSASQSPNLVILEIDL